MAILTHASQMLCAQKLASSIVKTLVGQAFMHFNRRFTSVAKNYIHILDSIIAQIIALIYKPVMPEV